MIRHLIRSMLGYRGVSAWEIEMGMRCNALRQLGASDEVIKAVHVLSRELAKVTLVSPKDWFDDVSGDVLARLMQDRHDNMMGIPPR